jgi:hypothetical protein
MTALRSIAVELSLLSGQIAVCPDYDGKNSIECSQRLMQWLGKITLKQPLVQVDQKLTRGYV